MRTIYYFIAKGEPVWPYQLIATAELLWIAFARTRRVRLLIVFSLLLFVWWVK